MDAAEQWLRDNDVRYDTTRKAWKHIMGKDYWRPSQEALSPDPSRYGYQSPDKANQRACELCGSGFYPRDARQRFCTVRHQATARKRRWRLSRQGATR